MNIPAQRFWSYEAHNLRCVRENDYDAAQSELAALREELAELHQQHSEQSCVFCNNSGELLTQVKALQSALTAADQRNATRNIESAAKVLASCMDYPWEHMPEQGRASMREHAKAVIDAALAQPTESGASE